MQEILSDGCPSRTSHSHSHSVRDDALGDGFEDLLVDLVDREVAFDEDDAAGLAGGDFAVLLPDAAEEGILLRLEAAFAGTRFGLDAIVAAARAVERGCKAGQKQKS